MTCKCQQKAAKVCSSFDDTLSREGLCLHCGHEEQCHQQLTADAQHPEHWAKSHDTPGMLHRIEELEAKVKLLSQAIDELRQK